MPVADSQGNPGFVNSRNLKSAMPPSPSPRLPRTLGLWSSVALVIGITIGSGIFRSPAAVARQVPSPMLMLGLWAAGGLVTLCGALSLAELSAALPESGGFYVYLREAWGPRVAFLFGWAQLVVLRASALGGIAIVFGEYLLRSLGLDPSARVYVARGVAAAAIALAATANITGVNVAAAIVSVSTIVKVSALLVLILVALVLGGSHGGSLSHLTAETSASIGAGSIGLALISVLWAYDGFGDLSIVGGEVKEPQKTLPAAIVIGTLTLLGIYVLANVAYLYVLRVDAVARSPLVAADTMMAIFGRMGVVLVYTCVTISAFSSLNGIMLTGPRIFFAMAEDGLFFEPLARVHPRFRTPHVAILLAGALGTVLVLSQTFEALTNAFVLAIWPFYALSVAAVYRLRVLRPDLPRPYKVVGYPIVPALFILATLWFVVNALVQEPVSTGITFGVILIGLPVYQIFFGSRVRASSDPGSRPPAHSLR